MDKDKAALMELFAAARKRAELGNLDIDAQQAIITALEARGIDATRANAILVKLIAIQDIDLAKMDRLLDELDKSQISD